MVYRGDHRLHMTRCSWSLSRTRPFLMPLLFLDSFSYSEIGQNLRGQPLLIPSCLLCKGGEKANKERKLSFKKRKKGTRTFSHEQFQVR